MWGAIIGAIGVGASIYSSNKQASDAEDHYEDQARTSAATAKKNAANVKSAAQRNAKLSLYDSSVAYKEAQEIFKASEIQTRNFLNQATQILATQKASYGKSGVAVGTGTPLKVGADTGAEIVRDALMIKYNGQTASSKAKELSKRYKKVADTTLQDAWEHAALIEEAGVYDASYYGSRASAAGDAAIYNSVSSGISGLYNVGSNEGWWD